MPLFPLHRRAGFTLIELIIVIAIIAIIAAVVFVAVDPPKRIHASHNAQRASDISSIVAAIKTYQADNGTWPPGLDLNVNTYQLIGENGPTDVQNCTASVPFSCNSLTFQTGAKNACMTPGLVVSIAPYLKKFPKDPITGVSSATGAVENTRYYLNVDGNGLLVVGACDPEGQGTGGNGPIPSIESSN